MYLPHDENAHQERQFREHYVQVDRKAPGIPQVIRTPVLFEKVRQRCAKISPARLAC